MPSPKPNPIESMDAIRRLAALRVLSERKDRLDLRLKAKRKDWAEALTEDSKALHGEIEKPNPGKLPDCKARLDEIRELYEKRKEDEAAKKKELDKIQVSIQRVDAAMTELIHADPDDTQQELELDERTEGLKMTAGAAEAVGEAIQDLVGEGAEIAPDVADLKKQLDAMGISGLRLVDGDDGLEEEAHENEGEF